jgi:Spy/CpxP family protein refolding chaperone
MKKILLCIVATMFATMTFAQHSGAPQRQPREFNPEEVAQRQTMRLHQALQLDSIQYQAVFLINYADALTMQDSMNVRRERMEKMRAEGKKPERVQPSEEQIKAMKELQTQREQVRNEQMQQILTPEQYDKYLQMQEEQRERMRQMRGKRGHGRPGGARGEM